MDTTTNRSRNTRTTTPSHRLSPEQRERLTRELAYYLAERDSFRGNPVEYWLKAERQVNSNC